MPMYEYKCGDCAREFEELVLSHGPSVMSCPHCRSTNTVKLMSAAAIGKSQGNLPSCGGACPGAATCNAARACSQFS